MAANGYFGWDNTTAANNGTADTAGGISVAEGATPPPNVNNGMRGMMMRFAQFLFDWGYQTAGGAADALTLTPKNVVTSYATNMVYTFRAASSNATTTPTLNISGVGTSTIRKIVGGVDVVLAAGDIGAAVRHSVVYDAAANAAAGAWILINPVTTLSAVSTFSDAAFRVQDNTDATKQLAFEVSGLTTATTRTVTAPDVSGVNMLTGAGQTTIASATTTDLSTSQTLDVIISGSTTITGFGTAPAGTFRQGYFTGAPLLTYNAVSLIMPSAANIQAAAGDAFTATSLGGGNWKILTFERASGSPVISSNMTLLATLTPVNGNATAITGTLPTTYTAFYVEGAVSSSVGTTFNVTISSDGGGTFDTAIQLLSGAANVVVGFSHFIGGVGQTMPKSIGGNSFSTKTSPTNCIKYAWNSGNFGTGTQTIRVFGVK